MKKNIEETNTSATPGYLPWLICLTSALFFFYEFIQIQILNALHMDFMRDFQLTTEEFGKFGAISFWFNAIFLLPAGLLLDRFSTRRIILTMMTVTVAATFILANATSFEMAKLARAMTGISGAFCLLTSVRLASRWFPTHKMALVSGLIVTMAMLGGLIAQTPAVLLADAYGWRNMMYLNFALGIVCWAMIFFIVKDTPTEKISSPIKEAQLPFWHSIYLAMSRLQNWLAGTYTCLLNLPLMLLGGAWGISYFVIVHELDRTYASYITMMIFFGTMIGGPLLGWWSDQLGKRKPVMIYGAIASLAIVLVIMYVPSLSLSALLLLFFLAGLTTSSQVLSYPTVAESNSRLITGTALGIGSTIIMSGPGFANPLFGWLMDKSRDGTVDHLGQPLYTASDYHLGMLIFPIAIILCLLAAFAIKETYCKLVVEK